VALRWCQKVLVSVMLSWLLGIFVCQSWTGCVCLVTILRCLFSCVLPPDSCPSGYSYVARHDAWRCLPSCVASSSWGTNTSLETPPTHPLAGDVIEKSETAASDTSQLEEKLQTMIATRNLKIPSYDQLVDFRCPDANVHSELVNKARPATENAARYEKALLASIPPPNRCAPRRRWPRRG
jgi:hypothetical protein